MINKDNLQKEVDELEKLASDIESRMRTLLESAPKSSERKYASATKEYYYVYHWKELTKDLENLRRDLTRYYQCWYSSAYPLVCSFVPEKEPEFKGYYDSVLKKIQLRDNPSSTSDMIESFIQAFEIQKSILLSVHW